MTGARHAKGGIGSAAVGVLLNRPLAPALTFSIAFALAISAGGVVYRGEALAGATALVVLLQFLGAAAATFALFQVVVAFARRCSERGRPTPDKALPKWWWAVAWALIFACWIPCLAAYAPGIFSYDMTNQTIQVFTGELSTDHPIAHTLFWAACLQAGGLLGIEPVTLYALLQMALLSFAFARLVKYLRERGVRIPWLVCATCFLAASPPFALMSIIPTKDVPFAAFLVLLSLSVCRLASDPGEFLKSPRSASLLAALVFACCIFRNNMAYAMLLSIPVFLAALRGYWLRILAVLACPLAAFALIGVSLSALGVTTSNMKWEAFSVPAQQIAYTATTHDSELADEDKQAIERFIPYEDMVASFNPRFADPVKAQLADEGKADFLKLWLGLGARYPKSYVYEFLNLNAPYWYPLAANIDPYSERLYIETGVFESEFYTFQRSGRFPSLFAFYERVADDGLSRVPLLSVPYSLPTPLWLFFGCACALAALRRKGDALVCAIPLCYLFTLLLAPVANFRYIFPLMCLFPLVIAVVFLPSRSHRLQ